MDRRGGRRNRFGTIRSGGQDTIPITAMDVHRECYPFMTDHILHDAERLATSGWSEPCSNLSQVETSYRAMMRAAARVGTDAYAGRVEPHPSPTAPPITAAECRWTMENNAPYLAYADALNLAMHGNRLIHAGETIVQRLAATSVNLPNHLFRTPFPAFALSSASKTLGRALMGARSGEWRPGMSVAAVVAMRSASKGKMIMITSHLVDRRVPVEILHATITLPDGGRLDQSLRAFLREVPGSELTMAHDQDGRDHMDSWFEDSAETYYRILLNLIVYATMPKARISEPQTASPRPMASQGPRLSVVHQEIGRGLPPIRIDPLVPTGAASETIGPGRPLDSRVMVIGHWRSIKGQAHLREDAELQWIEPYWKGPPDGPTTNRRHEIVA